MAFWTMGHRHENLRTNLLFSSEGPSNILGRFYIALSGIGHLEKVDAWNSGPSFRTPCPLFFECFLVSGKIDGSAFPVYLPTRAIESHLSMPSANTETCQRRADRLQETSRQSLH